MTHAPWFGKPAALCLALAAILLSGCNTTPSNPTASPDGSGGGTQNSLSDDVHSIKKEADIAAVAGEYGLAEALYDKVWRELANPELAKSPVVGGHPDHATLLLQRALNLSNQRRFHQADQLFEEAYRRMIPDAGLPGATNCGKNVGRLFKDELPPGIDRLLKARYAHFCALHLAHRAGHPRLVELMHDEVYASLADFADANDISALNYRYRLAEANEAAQKAQQGYCDIVLRNEKLHKEKLDASGASTGMDACKVMLEKSTEEWNKNENYVVNFKRTSLIAVLGFADLNDIRSRIEMAAGEPLRSARAECENLVRLLRIPKDKEKLEKECKTKTLSDESDRKTIEQRGRETAAILRQTKLENHFMFIRNRETVGRFMKDGAGERANPLGSLPYLREAVSEYARHASSPSETKDPAEAVGASSFARPLAASLFALADGHRDSGLHAAAEQGFKDADTLARAFMSRGRRGLPADIVMPYLDAIYEQAVNAAPAGSQAGHIDLRRPGQSELVKRFVEVAQFIESPERVRLQHAALAADASMRPILALEQSLRSLEEQRTRLLPILRTDADQFAVYDSVSREIEDTTKQIAKVLREQENQDTFKKYFPQQTIAKLDDIQCQIMGGVELAHQDGECQGAEHDGAEEAVVKIIVGDRHAYGLMIRKTAAIVYRIAMTRSELETRVDRIRTTVLDGKIQEAERTAFLLNGDGLDLFNALFQAQPPGAALVKPAHFKPYTDFLREESPRRVNALIVSVDGALASLPFAMLPLPDDAEPGGRWVVDEFSTLYHQDLSTLGLRRERLGSRSSPHTADILLAGDPVEPAPGVIDALERQLRPRGCSPIKSDKSGRRWMEDPYAITRAYRSGTGFEEHRACLPAGRVRETLSGSAFTHKNLTLLLNENAKASQPARFVEILTHGLIGNEVACLTSDALLASAPYDRAPADADIIRDLLLADGKLAGLDLGGVDLALLTACNSAGSDIREAGDRVGALADSFLRSGAGSVLITHWIVPVGPTLRLTEGFFAHQQCLEEELGPTAHTLPRTALFARALQRAQLSLMGRNPPGHDCAGRAAPPNCTLADYPYDLTFPYRWAGLTLFGG